MLKSEIQHHYWVTKKTVQRKLGSKEDECVVSSDAELDAKIELFKSINESCTHLHRVIDNYQERMYVLAQEETALGRFLKEMGRNSTTTGNVMSVAGKSVSYCGQQRMSLRAPLIRLHHEVDTFRGRAIVDTHMTIQAMERDRTEYRAALSWMKSASTQLDPDTGRGLDKFRKAQTHVRTSKAKFDRLTLDCLQKIDLLAAARCNMFSHALVAYQSTFLEFFIKTTETFKNSLAVLKKEPIYNFTILKELTQHSSSADGDENVAKIEHAQKPLDSDQMLFFKDEYKDDENTVEKQSLINIGNREQPTSAELLEPTLKLLDELSTPASATITQKSTPYETIIKNNDPNQSTSNIDLLGLGDDFSDFLSAKPMPFMPSQLLLNDLNQFGLNEFASLDKWSEKMSSTTADMVDSKSIGNISSSSTANQKTNEICGLLNRSSLPQKLAENPTKIEVGTGRISMGQNQRSQMRKEKTDRSDWFKLFSELDPLANPDLMERKIGSNSNSQAA